MHRNLYQNCVKTIQKWTQNSINHKINLTEAYFNNKLIHKLTIHKRHLGILWLISRNYQRSILNQSSILHHYSCNHQIRAFRPNTKCSRLQSNNPVFAFWPPSTSPLHALSLSWTFASTITSWIHLPSLTWAALHFIIHLVLYSILQLWIKVLSFVYITRMIVAYGIAYLYILITLSF